MTVLVLTPLAKELQTFLEALGQRGYSPSEEWVGRVTVYRLPELNLVLAQGGHGKVQFGVQSQYLLDQLPEIELLICVGAAGGIDHIIHIGDLVVATETVEHDYHIKFSVRPSPRFPGSSRDLESLRTISQDFQSGRIHFGIVASGDEDVIDSQRAHELYTEFGAQAVAWEGAGGARACAFMDVPYLEIRGVTDTADHDAPIIFDENLRVVIPRIVELLVLWSDRTSSS